jgi:hypothetical protein
MSCLLFHLVRNSLLLDHYLRRCDIFSSIFPLHERVGLVESMWQLKCEPIIKRDKSNRIMCVKLKAEYSKSKMMCTVSFLKFQQCNNAHNFTNYRLTRQLQIFATFQHDCSIYKMIAKPCAALAWFGPLPAQTMWWSTIFLYHLLDQIKTWSWRQCYEF